MRRKIFKAGNSLVISLPAAWVRDRGLKDGSEVELRVAEAGRLEVQPAVEHGVSTEFAQQVDAFIDHYREALDELAKR